MGDEDITKSIKRTQDQLGKFVKKPPLTDKNLSRPPFRFLHDIVKNVIDSTGFMADVFTPEELDAATVTSREAKTAFMQKLLGAIKERTGEDVPLKISKVLAGLEADKTNGLLQSLAKSIELHQHESGPPPASTAKKASKKPPAKPAAPPAKKAVSKPAEKKEPASGTKRTIRDASPASKPAAKKPSGDPQPKSKTGSGGKTKAPPQSQPEMAEAPTVPESIVNDETGNNEEQETTGMKKPPPILAREPSKADLLQGKKPTETGSVVAEEVDLDNRGGTTAPSDVANFTNANNNHANYANNTRNDNDDEMGQQLELYDNFAASVVKPNMQTLPPPKSPIMSDADAVNATMELPPPTPSPAKNKTMSLTTPGLRSPSASPTSPVVGRGGSGRPPTTGSTHKSLSREASAEQKGSPYGSATIGEVRPPTGQSQQVRSRPDTGTAGGRLTSARPPSAARRAPPRPKSSVVKEDAEPYRPTTGKVAHVILDDNEDPDDDNYVVREVTVTASKPPGLSDLDETPELNLGGGLMLSGALVGEGLDDILPPDQRGLLVNQILETQKELEDKKGPDETPMIEKKLKELSLAEIEKLKNLIQLCARSANPLAKLLDYMAEDVDAMQKEHNNYREESKRLSLELENAKGETEKHLLNLKLELTEIERKIKDKQDAILASQMKIIQQEERIEEIVAGFERVRSGKSAAGAKEHMPDAEEILAHIQGQTSNLGGGGNGPNFGGGGVGPPTPSVFTFSGGGGRLGSSTPSSAASTIGGPPQEGFKIPDSFMDGPGSSSADPRGNISSPFSRGRMWSSTASNNNSATFNLTSRNSMEEDPNEEAPPGSLMTRRNMGRSGSLMGGGGGGALMSDVDNFNPWV